VAGVRDGPSSVMLLSRVFRGSCAAVRGRGRVASVCREVLEMR
jgi:hypothetical protein